MIGRMRVTPNRLVWALLVTLGFSRHQYVHVSFSQKLDVVIDGLEEAWEVFWRCAFAGRRRQHEDGRGEVGPV